MQGMDANKVMVIALQYHEGDKADAMRLMRLIADIEGGWRDDVYFLCVHTAEAGPSWENIRLLRGMMVYDYAVVGAPKGWPAGPNFMAKAALDEILRRWLYAGWNEIDGVLLLEPDCIPIQRDWIDQLMAEWKIALAAGKWMMGTWRDGGGGHINGNCAVRPDFARLVDFNNVPKDLAWDCAIAPYVKDHWHVTNLICNRWKETALTDEQIETHRDGGEVKPVLLHGVKDQCVYEYARRKLCP